MNPIQTAIVALIRDLNEKEISKPFSNMTDEQLIRAMFQNFRGTGKKTKGLRLTNFGKEIMQSYFAAYEVSAFEQKPLGAKEIIYLDRRAKLPYYIEESTGNMIMFETELGVLLKMNGGNLQTLIELDG